MNFDALTPDKITNAPAKKAQSLSAMTIRTGIRAGATKYMRNIYAY